METFIKILTVLILCFIFVLMLCYCNAYKEYIQIQCGDYIIINNRKEIITYKSIFFNYIETDKQTKVSLNYALELLETK